MKTKKIVIPEQVVEITFAQYVGRRIRERRKKLKLSQDDVVQACDISKTFLSECENGKRSIGYYKACQLAQVLHCSVAWFAKGWN